MKLVGRHISFYSRMSIFKRKPFICSLIRLYNFMMTSIRAIQHSPLPPHKKCARTPMQTPSICTVKNRLHYIRNLVPECNKFAIIVRILVQMWSTT